MDECRPVFFEFHELAYRKIRSQPTLLRADLLTELDVEYSPSGGTFAHFRMDSVLAGRLTTFAHPRLHYGDINAVMYDKKPLSDGDLVAVLPDSGGGARLLHYDATCELFNAKACRGVPPEDWRLRLLGRGHRILTFPVPAGAA